MSKAYASLNANRKQVLEDITGTETIRVLEQRYDNGRIGRLADWFNINFGCSPTVYRRRAAAGATAIVSGSFYFLDSPVSTRWALAKWLESQRTKTDSALPYGDYQIWVIDGHVCVMCTDGYRLAKSVYSKVYKYDLNLDHPLLKGSTACIHDTGCRGVPLPDSTIAYMFNLIWFPQL